MRIFRNESGMEFHDLQSSDPAQDIKSEKEREVITFEEMTLGIYETAKYMLYHNQK